MEWPLLDAIKATPPRLPPIFIGGFADMASLFYSIAQSRGYPAHHASRVWGLLPAAIGSLPCFLDRLTGIWRYDYGAPLEVGESRVFGTPMFPDVETLFDVIGCASWRLTESERGQYLVRLADPPKHEETVVEFAPILRLSDDVKVRSEVSAGGAGNTTVDWCVCVKGYPQLFLEVKARVGVLIEHLRAMKAEAWREPIPEPSHDHRQLFRSVEKKFGLRDPSEAIHCVWIKTDLMQEEDELRQSFESLDPGRIHAVVVANWGEEAHVLAADRITRQRVMRILRLRQASGLTFRRRGSADSAL